MSEQSFGRINIMVVMIICDFDDNLRINIMVVGCTVDANSNLPYLCISAAKSSCDTLTFLSHLVV